MRLQHPARFSSSPDREEKKKKKHPGKTIQEGRKRRDRRLGGIMDQIRGGRR